VGISNSVSLGSLRWQAQQRADMEGNDAVSTPEWNQYISQSRKRLFNMLVAASGNNYNVAPLFQFNLTNSQYYPLPNGTLATIGTTSFAPALFKLLRVDLQYSASPTGFVTLKRFEEIETNKYAWPNSAINTNGYTNLKYKLQGQNIKFIPVPMSGQLVQLEYIEKPKDLQFIETCATVGSMSLSMNDVTDLSVGMSVQGPTNGSVIQLGSTVTSIQTSPTNQVTLSLPTLSVSPVQTVAFWVDSVTVDGVSGWDEFVVIDAAIKAQVKQENPVEELMAQRMDIVAEIEGLAEGRDMGQAFHVSDVLGANACGMMGDGGGYGWEDNW
jgi:hypothetical protein